ncbi:cytoskeleton-associated protein 4 [Bombina bombina]|uniref:cytoskeleton-associated protein 4 n=1 Tax=Bombina bombina TaxID=8345 RepID=UPI00235A632E|nr:cytoskeleton-associated protein 4 [Bombina bombina]
MSNARQRNKTSSADTNSQSAPENVAKKHNKSKGASSPGATGVFWKLLSFLFYASLLAVAALSGWFVHNLVGEMSDVYSKMDHLSQQKGELAKSVDTLQKQVDLLQKTVGRLEFISKDVQEKQLTHDVAIKKGEKEMDQIGVVLKKMQKDLSSVVQDVRGQGERDLLLFEKTTKEKLTELTNSINDEITEFAEMQKASQNEINNIKTKLSSLGEVNSVNEEVKTLKEHTSELQNNFKSNQESIEWLINTVQTQNDEAVTANNDIAKLRIEYDDFKKAVDSQLTVVEDLKEKISRNEESSLNGELDKLVKEHEQLSSTVTDLETNLASSNNDLIKEIKNSKDSIVLRLTPLEKLAFEAEQHLKSIENVKSKFEEYNRRLNAVEEGLAGVKVLSASGDSEIPETLATLKKTQETLSKDIDELRAVIGEFPSTALDFQNLQLEVSSALESHKNQLEELKYDYDQLKNTESAEQLPTDGLRSSVNQLETDLKMLRTAVDSLVAYSVKIETNEKDLQSLKDSLEELKENTEKLQIKFEQIQEAV